MTADTQPSWGGGGGGDTETDVTITNVSKKPTVAFFLRADVRRGSPRGTPAPGDNEVLPIMWTDNDVTLWPGESETLRATYRRSALAGGAVTGGQRVRLERRDAGRAIGGAPDPDASVGMMRHASRGPSGTLAFQGLLWCA